MESFFFFNFLKFHWFIYISHPTACTIAENTVPLESAQTVNTSFAYPRYGVTRERRLEGYFRSDTVFNLSRKVLTDTEIRILEKELGFAPIQNKINEPELRTDFEEFCRRMRTRWHLRNEPTPEFSETPVFQSNLPGNHLWVTLMLRCS